MEASPLIDNLTLFMRVAAPAAALFCEVLKMKELCLDLETYSSVDIGKSGVYRYAESPDFEILLFACSVDGKPVQVFDLVCGEKVPDEILKALSDEKVIKHSFNASFERICLSRYLGLPPGTYLSPDGWHCDMVWAADTGSASVS